MILNTRPARYHDAFAQAFDSFGHEIVSCPMLSIEALDAPLPDAATFDAIIFTSQVAVSLFPLDAAWRSKRVFAVGNATAIAALTAGFTDIMCTGENAVDLLIELKRTRFAQALFPSAADVAADLSQALPAQVVRVITYKTMQTPYVRSSLVHRLKTGETTYVPLFSTRSAIAFHDALAQEGLSPAATRMTIIAISPAVAQALSATGYDVRIAPHMTTESMAETLAGIVNNRTALAA